MKYLRHVVRFVVMVYVALMVLTLLAPHDLHHSRWDHALIVLGGLLTLYVMKED